MQQPQQQHQHQHQQQQQQLHQQQQLMQQPTVKPEPRSGSAYASRHQAAEQRRRTRINERLDKLRELVPHAERANTAAFLETVIEYIQELQALLKCGPSRGMAGAKPPGATGPGAVPVVGPSSVVGSGPYGVATPGGGFEVLQASQGHQPGGGSGASSAGAAGGAGAGAATIVSTLGGPASLPFFQNGSNGLGAGLPFQSAAMPNGNGGHTFFQTGGQPVASSGGPLAHHAFASPQQLVNCGPVPLAVPAPALQAPQAQQQGQIHFDPAQQLALQQMVASARANSSSAVSAAGNSPIDHLYLQAASQLGSGGGGGGGLAGALPGSDSGAPAAMAMMDSVPLPLESVQQPLAPTVVSPQTSPVGTAGATDSEATPEVSVIEASRKRFADGGFPPNSLPPSSSPHGSDSEAGVSSLKRKRTPSRSHT